MGKIISKIFGSDQSSQDKLIDNYIKPNETMEHHPNPYPNSSNDKDTMMFKRSSDRKVKPSNNTIKVSENVPLGVCFEECFKQSQLKCNRIYNVEKGKEVGTCYKNDIVMSVDDKIYDVEVNENYDFVRMSNNISV